MIDDDINRILNKKIDLLPFVDSYIIEIITKINSLGYTKIKKIYMLPNELYPEGISIFGIPIEHKILRDKNGKIIEFSFESDD